jgi:uncharacterized membrane protein YgcG
MKRFWQGLLALLLVLGPVLLVQSPAQAAGEDWRITDYRAAATVDAAGTTSVQLTFDFDFGTDPGHGPYLTFPLRQEIANDPDHWRMIDMTIGDVSSPSGANAELQTEEKDGNLLIRVGNANRTFTGVQTYQVNYTIRGLIAPEQAQSGLDELNWNAVGTGWEVPISAVEVTVAGPAAISKVACFAGYDFSEPCQGVASGSTATFSATDVGNGSGVQVTAGFPAGTFTGADARIERRFTIGNMFPVNAFTGGVTAVLSALAVAFLYRRTRQGSRDQVYLGLTPGVAPAPGQQAAVGYETGTLPVAVQFSPPAGARPGELGTLIDSTADNRDVTAGILDLAVRGHLRIEQLDQDEWAFTLLNGPGQLADYEGRMLAKLFAEGNRVTTEDLKQPQYAGLLTQAREDLHTRVTKELGWFTRNPSVVRGLAFLAGIVIVAASVGAGLLFGLFGWGLVGLAGVILGLGVLVMNNHFGARTAAGSAMLAQTKGFELYLRTAEADQIRFEEGIDVFSRYLPYAIMFGVAERWTQVFEQLAAQGRYAFNTPWYVGYGYGYGFGYNGFASSMDSLANTMSSSLQHATAATSGGSGFSGGGGFGGGGGGGW